MSRPASDPRNPNSYEFSELPAIPVGEIKPGPVNGTPVDVVVVELEPPVVVREPETPAGRTRCSICRGSGCRFCGGRGWC